jgi:ribonuclease E
VIDRTEAMTVKLRLRDIGGIIVIDFIDMVLESNRDLVLRRLTECLGRDRTRHQVAEVTSLGLVQMTRKRVGTGLLEAFGTTCEHCKGRGVLVSTEPVGKAAAGNGSTSGGGGGGGRRSRSRGEDKDKEAAKEAAAKEAAAKEAAKAVRDIAKATTRANGDSAPTDASDSAGPESETSDYAPAAAGSPATTAAEPVGGDPEDAEPAPARTAGRVRRRSRRSAGEPSASVEPAATPPVATAPAGTASFTQSGTPDVTEQANGHGHEAEQPADQDEHADSMDGSAPAESSAAPVNTPPRRPVRRGASRPAGPPVSATHDG